MRMLCFLIALGVSSLLFGQQTTSVNQQIPTSGEATLVINIDSTDVNVVRYDGYNIQIVQNIAFEKKDTPFINELLRADDFQLSVEKESDQTILLAPKKIRWETEGDPLTVGSFYTIYLPYSIQEVEWITNIPSSLVYIEE